MTGEITLHGNVLPIGGLKEKSMAAFREGISTVLIPRDNASDLYEVDAEVKEKVRFIPVEHAVRGAEARPCSPGPHPRPRCPRCAAGNLSHRQRQARRGTWSPPR